MAPAEQYIFAEMLGISEHFIAGSHEWLPYSVIPTFPKLVCKQQFIVLLFLIGSPNCQFHTFSPPVRNVIFRAGGFFAGNVPIRAKFP